MQDRLSAEELAALGERIAEQAVHLDAAMHRLLADLRAFDESGGWFRQGFASCAHWLSWRVGWAPATARERVRVARALAALPRVDGALAAGTVSYSKVRAISRVATPASEPALLRYAEVCTASQLETICRKVEAAEQRARPQERPRHDERWVIGEPAGDGRVCIKAMLRADEAAVLLGVIQQAARHGRQGASDPGDASAETPIRGAMPPRVDRADGLMAVIQAYARGTSANRSPIELIVTAPAEALQPNQAESVLEAQGAEPAVPGAAPMAAVRTPGAELPVGIVAETDLYLSPETTRRLACDCGLVEAKLAPDGQPLSVGRKTRTIPAAIKRALLLRDRTCRFPGCDHRRFLDGHHVKHWADGGETTIDNLTLLCSRHHSYVHERGYQICRDQAGALCFLDPQGQPVRTVPPRPQPHDLGWPAIRAGNAELELTAETGRCRWRGDRIDHREAVNAICRIPPGQAGRRVARAADQTVDGTAAPRARSSPAPLDPHYEQERARRLREEYSADPDYDLEAATEHTENLLPWALAVFRATGVDPLSEGPAPRYIPPRSSWPTGDMLAEQAEAAAQAEAEQR